MKFFSQIKKEFNELPVTREKLRSFGLLMAGVFALLGCVGAWRGHRIDSSLVLISIALLFAAATIFAPMILRAPYRLWMGLAIVLGSVISPIVFTILFFLFLTPISLLKRLFTAKNTAGKETYWLPYKGEQTPKSMEQLF